MLYSVHTTSSTNRKSMLYDVRTTSSTPHPIDGRVWLLQAIGNPRAERPISAADGATAYVVKEYHPLGPRFALISEKIFLLVHSLLCTTKKHLDSVHTIGN